MKRIDYLFILFFAVVFAAGVAIVAAALSDLSERMDAAHAECNARGGQLVDSSSGFVCLNERGTK
jgi:hypothetical protein